MPLISLTGAYLAFSDAPLLDNTDLFIDENERVCLVLPQWCRKIDPIKSVSQRAALR